MKNVVVKIWFLLMLISAPSVWAVEIESIKVESNNQRIRMTLSEDAAIRYFSLQSPHRLVMDFENTERKVRFPVVSKNALIKALRGAQRDKDYRVVIDLHSPVDVTLKEILDSKNKKSYVRVDLSLKKDSSVKKQTAKKAAAKKTVVKEEKDLDAKEIIEKQYENDQPVKKALKEVDQLKNDKRVILVAIDAGHGGSDPGAISASGIKEKDIVLAISKELEKLLDREPGFYSKTIRKTDKYVGLKQRRELARDKHADLFISLHADAFPDRRVSGASVYVLSRRGATSATAKFLAENETISDKLGDINLANKDALLTEVLVDLAMNDKMSASVDIGQVVLKQLSKATKLHSPRVEKAAFAVLKTPDLPALLIETGFISNNAEAKKLSEKHTQQQIAQAIFQAIKSYYMKHPPEGSYIAWKQSQAKK